MLKWFAISLFAVPPALAGLMALSISALDPTSGSVVQQHSAHPAAPTQLQAPSEAEMESRAEKLIANQHQDDMAIEQYERIEHQVNRTGGASPKILEDRIFRIVPTGTGTLKILLSDNGKSADPADYRKQLQLWQQTLELALNPSDSRAKVAYAKFDKKKKDRAELIAGIKEGFTTKWVGSETISGRLCDVLQLDPNPNFHPHTLFQEAISRVTAKIWVDHAENQLVHAEARVVRDLTFGAGILGKLYRGGVFSIDQSEVAPGIWLPVRYQYDFTARKVFFTFEQHQFIEASRYHRVGPPKDALAIVQKELAGGKAFNADP